MITLFSKENLWDEKKNLLFLFYIWTLLLNRVIWMKNTHQFWSKYTCMKFTSNTHHNIIQLKNTIKIVDTIISNT